MLPQWPVVGFHVLLPLEVMVLDCDQLCSHYWTKALGDTLHFQACGSRVHLHPVRTGETSNGLGRGRKVTLTECFLAGRINICHCAWLLALSLCLRCHLALGGWWKVVWQVEAGPRRTTRWWCTWASPCPLPVSKLCQVKAAVQPDSSRTAVCDDYAQREGWNLRRQNGRSGCVRVVGLGQTVFLFL